LSTRYDANESQLTREKIMGTELATIDQAQGHALTLNEVTARVNLVHRVMQTVMQKGTHFGTVPGCGSKMVLLKPGADVLATTFRLVPQFKVERSDMPNGHREYDVTCSMYAHDGALLGQGVGSASTMEKKYRWRKDDKGQKIENEDIADMYNTVLKIAKKRAHIDATLTVTGAADLFTQDLIEEDGETDTRPPVAMPQERAPEHAPAGTDRKTVTGMIEDVQIKSGKNAKGGDWTRYGVKVAGAMYGTFDATLGNKALAMREAAEEVVIVFATDAKGYHTIETIEFAAK
jgi:hypothetical protein